jgi:hypothetical protein
MRTQLFRWSDQHVAPLMVLTRRLVVIYFATTHDAGGDLHGCPNRSVALDFADATANRATDASEASNGSMDRRWSPPTPSLSG